jgi:lipopolysaccharide transport system ATP-binding protein
MPSDSSVAIEAQGVGKRYQLNAGPAAQLRRLLFGVNPSAPVHTALEDVSFTVRRGEILGIIGRNGAGKSTLLQIIAGTLPPSAGSLKVRGRISAMLELGAGFNPDFTGRENVFMYGAVLGVDAATLHRRFSDIAAFADIGSFMDRPVKTYSSGMFVRLAFAVGTCLEPEVLIVDEALAVGDVFFQQKCHARLRRLVDAGTSVLFVSHALGEVAQLCDRVLVLEQGRTHYLGDPRTAVAKYRLLEHAVESVQATPEPTPEPIVSRVSSGQAISAPNSENAWMVPANSNSHCASYIADVRVAVCDAHGMPSHQFAQGDRLCLHVQFRTASTLAGPMAGYMLTNQRNVQVHGKILPQFPVTPPAPALAGSTVLVAFSIALNLECGGYSIEIGLADLDQDIWHSRGKRPWHELDPGIREIGRIVLPHPIYISRRDPGPPTQLSHYGIADLPGEAFLQLIPPPMSEGPEQP